MISFNTTTIEPSIVGGKPQAAFVFGAHSDEIRGTFCRIHPRHKITFANARTKELPEITAKQWQPMVREALDGGSSVSLFTYNFREPQGFQEFADKTALGFTRFEDGFIRCNGIGSTHLPYSWVFDNSGGLYFSAQRPSDLEKYIQNFDPSNNVLDRAELLMQTLIGLNLSKYNHGDALDIATVYGPKTRNRVLVLGQVPDDQSIALGCDKPLSNNDLVRLAHQEMGRDCDILYRPHPYVLHGNKNDKDSDPAEVANIATVITQSMPLPTALQTIDHVYVQSSLAGFEAVIRGIPVTTTGCPFYSGWNNPLIDSRQPNPRRTATRSTLEIFAAAYIQYPRYFDPQTGCNLQAIDVLKILAEQRTAR